MKRHEAKATVASIGIHRVRFLLVYQRRKMVRGKIVNVNALLLLFIIFIIIYMMIIAVVWCVCFVFFIYYGGC